MKPGGAGRLSTLISHGFPLEVLEQQKKQVIGIFDSDKKGLSEASKIHQTFHIRPGPGNLVPVKEDLLFYYNFPIPKALSCVTTAFSDNDGPEIEHLFYHIKTELSVTFDSKHQLSPNAKKKFVKKLTDYSNSLNETDKLENAFREVAQMVKFIASNT